MRAEVYEMLHWSSPPPYTPARATASATWTARLDGMNQLEDKTLATDYGDAHTNNEVVGDTLSDMSTEAVGLFVGNAHVCWGDTIWVELCPLF